MNTGRSFDQALRAAYKMALASPQFLFLQESPGTLTDHALAARLSYGLWSSLPDTELIALADGGVLSDPLVLPAHRITGLQTLAYNYGRSFGLCFTNAYVATFLG